MSLYERLGLNRDADTQEIRKAYLKLSKTEHPDKGGNEDRFKSIQQAYEVLSNDESKNFYDQTGQIPGEEQSMQGHGHGIPSMAGMPGMPGMPFGMPFGDLGAMFGNMFQGGRGREPNRKQHKPQPKVHEVAFTLRDFFYGKGIELKFERQKFCKQCKGEGAENFDSCGMCNGSGTRETHIMIGPGMVAMSRGPCEVCNGLGKKSVGVCSGCRGMKFVSQEKTLQITIEPGMGPGDVMKFSNECSDNHGYEEPGDVHIILREADDVSRLVRIEETLSTVHTITLSEALLGSKMVVTGHPAHPNGLTVNIPIGTMHGDTITVSGEGMPCRGTTRRGNLQVSISLTITQSEKERLLQNQDTLRSLFR
jgi:DnaJ family protein A protein 2